VLDVLEGVAYTRIAVLKSSDSNKEKITIHFVFDVDFLVLLNFAPPFIM
jgi:hypothetical protein